MAVIVNDMAEVNIDAMLVKSEQVLNVQDKMVEMQNGCICCTLRDDLIEHVASSAQRVRLSFLCCCLSLLLLGTAVLYH